LASAKLHEAQVHAGFPIGVAYFGDRDRSFQDRDRRSPLGRVADQAIVTKIVALIEQRSALTARRLLEGDPETEEQDTDES
jgi:hypothetical protein